ncbi:MAG TPA: peptidoglycan-binding domain-containing protein [Bryobacteraceae bacterium]|nr:peptidoglycan-binding domain-containing protein [Bryobacteraceae bacterium]
MSSKTASSRKGKTAKKPVVAAYRQTVPTPDRYKEIQQALVDKGYLKSEANGVWDNDSVEALRQFQTDQKLTPTGKLTSASLIALGLGPKTDGASLTQPPPSPIEPPPSVTTAPVPAN